MTDEELKVVLENHKHWLNEDCDGWEKMKAEFHGADLRGADLREANLHRANLCGANLRGADLRGAELYGADLREAYLRVADLREADLREADLRGAELYRADLREADLRGAELYGANLREANLYRVDLREANLLATYLYGANLREANLREANLHVADLREADLYEADLRGAKSVPFVPFACPEVGAFIGYKNANNYIVELEVPEDAKRLSASTRKCRCNKAKVLRIFNDDRTIAAVTEVSSNRNNDLIYKIGEVVSVDNFDEDRWNECSTGIHFFINFQDAVDY